MERQPTIWSATNPKPTAYPESPFAAGSDTSWYAAHSIPPERLQGLRRQVLWALRHAYPLGLTDDELSSQLGEYRYSVAPRRKWLCEADLVEDSGDRRMGPRGRSQTVWAFKLSGSFIEPKGSSHDKADAELSYPEALRQIDALHSGKAQGPLGVNWCPECGELWPCPTNQIIEKARRGQRSSP